MYSYPKRCYMKLDLGVFDTDGIAHAVQLYNWSLYTRYLGTF